MICNKEQKKLFQNWSTKRWWDLMVTWWADKCNSSNRKNSRWWTLRKKSPCLEFFWSVFFCVWSEYGKIRTLYTHTGSKTRKRREEITSEKKPIHVPPKVLKFAVESFQVFFIKLDFRKNRCCSYNTYKNRIIIHLSFISTEAVIQKCSVKKVLRKIHRKTKLSASTLLKRDSDTGVFFL